jgi:hypothetical protein
MVPKTASFGSGSLICKNSQFNYQNCINIFPNSIKMPKKVLRHLKIPVMVVRKKFKSGRKKQAKKKIMENNKIK